MEKKKRRNYGWLIVAMFAFGTFSYQYTQYQLSVVAGELIGKLGLTGEQFSSIFTSTMVPAIFLSIIFGIIIDKIGMKLGISIFMLISCIGGVGHVFADSNGTMYVTMMLTGFGATALNVTSGKMFSNWLKPGLISIGMGCFLSASTLGQLIAQSTTAMIGSLTTAFWIAAILIIAAFIAWAVLGKDKSSDGQVNVPAMEQPSLGETVRVVFKSRNMWLCAFGIFFILGSQVACNTWLPTALVSKGMSVAQAGIASSVVSLGNLCGALFMPMVAAAVGKDKPFIIAFTAICAVGYAFGWQLDGIACYVSFFIFGLCAAALMPFFFSMPIKFKEVGPKYAGTATGLISTIELLGAVVLPTNILLPLASTSGEINFVKYYYLIGACWVIALIICLFLPETAVKTEKVEVSKKL